MITPQTVNGDAASTRAPIVISLLGSFQLTLGGEPAPIVSESKSEQLILCLALAHQHRIARGLILERVWPNSDTALAGQSLNSLSHFLNKLCSGFLNGARMIVYENGYYRLNIAVGVWVDVDHFTMWSEMGKRLLASGDPQDSNTYCERALKLYKGDLCGDSCIQTIIERERLRAEFLDLLVRLADHYHTRGDPRKALYYVQRLLAHDSCREDAHRLAMRCYVHLNQRAQALRQYRLCYQALALEFDAKPEPQTVALFDQIRLGPASV